MTGSAPFTLIKDHLAGGASRLAALLLPQILPVFSVVAPCQPGAALRDLVLVQRERTAKRALLVVTGLVGIALFAESLRMLGLEHLVDGFRRVGWGFGAILLVSGAREVARTLAWIRTVEGPARLPFARAFRARLAGEALNTLLPMGMLVGEPVKASHVSPHLPFAAAFSALVVEFAFYCISLVVLLGSWMTAFLVAAHVSPGPRVIAGMAASIVALAVLLLYSRRVRSRFSPWEKIEI